MSRPKASWTDIANFGANVYQARQMSKLSQQQAEQNALLEMQMQHMQMQQAKEDARKTALKTARNMILEFEEQLLNIENRFMKNPILASIETDAVEMAFLDLKNGGMDSNFFEDMYDLERYKKVESKINQLKSFGEQLSIEHISIKDDIIQYSSQLDDIEEAIKLCENIPIVKNRYEELNVEVSKYSPKWNKFEKNAIRLNEKLDNVTNSIIIAVSLGVIIGFSMIFFFPESIGIDSNDEDIGSSIGTGLCLGWIIICGITGVVWGSKTIDVPKIEDLLNESMEAIEEHEDNEWMIDYYNDDDDDDENELEEGLSGNAGKYDFDINFVVPHSGEPFEEYFVWLKFTLEGCESKLGSMESRLKHLQTIFNISELEEFKSLLNSNQQFINFYTNENLNTISLSNNNESGLNFGSGENTANSNTHPPNNIETTKDDEGYEWCNYNNIDWYRIADSSDNWTEWKT